MEPSAKKHQIPELPYEIWSQILLCLPAKTLIDLKSVCKNWRNIINSHNFQVSHVDNWRNRVPSEVIAMSPLRSAPELLSLDLVGDDIPSNVRSCPLIRFEKFFRRSQRQLSGGPTPAMNTTVLDCHDGLFLVAVGKWKHVFLCNPLTNSYLALPFPKKGFADRMYGWTIVYDPSTRGYVIFYIGCNFVSNIQVVFSLRIELNGVYHGRKSTNWRQLWSSENLTLMFPETRVLDFVESIFINCKAHWLFRFHDYETGILTIDATTEESIVTKCSATPTTLGKFFKANKKFYCLKAFYNSLREDELWAIDDVDNPTWLKQHVIIQNGLESMGRLCKYSVLLKEGNRLIMRSPYSKDMYIYDISLKKWHLLDLVDSDGNKNWWSMSAVLMSIQFSLLKLELARAT